MAHLQTHSYSPVFVASQCKLWWFLTSSVRWRPSVMRCLVCQLVSYHELHACSVMRSVASCGARHPQIACAALAAACCLTARCCWVWQVQPTAKNARNHSQCDSMLIGDTAGANTYPYIQARPCEL